MSPFKNTTYRDEIRWSEWLESMRKDVKCAFGILKGRFRILKTGVRLHAIKSVDMIWLTCCALHNMLLEIDGLDEPWDGRQINTSEWEGDLGELEPNDVPLAMRRVLNPAQIRKYDTTQIGLVNHNDEEEDDDRREAADGDEQDVAEALEMAEDNISIDDDFTGNVGGVGGVRVVRNLSLQFFRSKLVEHFNIMFRRGELNWPKRKGPQPSEYYDQFD